MRVRWTFLGPCWNQNFQKPPREDGMWKEVLFVWTYIDQVPKPPPLKPVLGKVQLGLQQSQKQRQRPELPFHGADWWSSRSKLIRVCWSVCGVQHDPVPCGHWESRPCHRRARNPEHVKRKREGKNFFCLEILNIQVSPACSGHNHSGHRLAFKCDRQGDR